MKLNGYTIEEVQDFYLSQTQGRADRSADRSTGPSHPRQNLTHQHHNNQLQGEEQMRFINKTGSTDNFALDIAQDGKFTHRLAVVTNEGVQRLILRDADRNQVAERIGAKGISLSEDDIHAWVSEKLAN